MSKLDHYQAEVRKGIDAALMLWSDDSYSALDRLRFLARNLENAAANARCAVKAAEDAASKKEEQP